MKKYLNKVDQTEITKNLLLNIEHVANKQIMSCEFLQPNLHLPLHSPNCCIISGEWINVYSLYYKLKVEKFICRKKLLELTEFVECQLAEALRFTSRLVVENSFNVVQKNQEKKTS